MGNGKMARGVIAKLGTSRGWTRKKEPVWCVPSALQAITGKDTQDIHDDLRKLDFMTYRDGIVGVTFSDVLRILTFGHNEKYGRVLRYGGQSTNGAGSSGLPLGTWIRVVDAGRYMISIWVTSSVYGPGQGSHAVAVEKLKNGDAWIADTANRKPKLWSRDRIRGFGENHVVNEYVNFLKWHKPGTGGTPERRGNLDKIKKKLAKRVEIVETGKKKKREAIEFKINVMGRTVAKIESQSSHEREDGRGTIRINVYVTWPKVSKRNAAFFGIKKLKSKGIWELDVGGEDAIEYIIGRLTPKERAKLER